MKNATSTGHSPATKEEAVFLAEIRKNKAVCLPDIQESKELIYAEKTLLCALYGLALRYDSGCTHSNATIAKAMACSEKYACKLICNLVRKGMLLRVYRPAKDGYFQRLLIPPTLRAFRTFSTLLRECDGTLETDNSPNANRREIKAGIGRFADYVEARFDVNFDNLRAFAGLPIKHAFSQVGDPTAGVSGIPPQGDNNYGYLKDIRSENTPTPQAGLMASLSSNPPESPVTATSAQPSASPEPTQAGALPPVHIEWPAKPHPQFVKMRREYPGVLEQVLAYCTGDTPALFVAQRSDVVRRLRRALRANKVTLEILAGLEVRFELSGAELTVQQLLNNVDDYMKGAREETGAENAACVEFEAGFSAPVDLNTRVANCTAPLCGIFKMHFSDQPHAGNVANADKPNWTLFLLKFYRDTPAAETRVRFTKDYSKFLLAWLGDHPADALGALNAVTDDAEFREVFGFDAAELRTLLEQRRKENFEKWRSIRDRFGWLRSYDDKYFNINDRNYFYEEAA